MRSPSFTFYGISKMGSCHSLLPSPFAAASGNIFRLRITHTATRAYTGQLALTINSILGVDDPTVSH
jgi:hypothetical protein